jgi:phosphoglycerol transferase
MHWVKRALVDWHGYGMRNYYRGSLRVWLEPNGQRAASIASWVRGAALLLERQSPLILLLIYGALSLCLMANSLALQYPSVMGDEYYYSIQARYFYHSSTLFAHNRYLPYYPNELYLWLFHSLRFFKDNFYQSAKILNSLLFAAAIFPIYGLSRPFLRHATALLLSTLIIIAPMEIYTTFFTPESCYFLGFWMFVFLFLSNLPHRALAAGILGGGALGLLILIKPHALALLAGANLTVITAAFLPNAFAFRRRDAVRCFVVLNGACLAAVAALHGVAFRDRSLDIFGLYWGLAYAPLPNRLFYVRQVIAILLDHLAYIAPMFGLPIVATCLTALGLLPANLSESLSRLRILSTFAIMTCSFLLLMTTSATARFGQDVSGELARMHGRYYDFALPLFLISFYALRGGKPGEEVRKSLFFGILVCLVLVLVGWRFLARLRPVYFFDYPEVAWATAPHKIALSIFWPVAVLVLIYYAITGLRERTTFSIYLVTMLIVGSLLTVSARRTLDLETQPDQAAALVRDLFDGNERDLGLVVGSDLVSIFRCLFGIQANPSVLLLPRGATINRPQIGKQIRWILALDDYDLRVPSTTLLSLPQLKILLLQAPTKRTLSKSSR